MSELHPLRRLAPSWFAQPNAFWVTAAGRVPLEVDSMHAHGGRFRLRKASPPALGETVALEFQKPDTGTTCLIDSWVTSSRDGTFTVAFLSLLEHVPGARQRRPEGMTLSCPESYPPLAWADHPFYDKHRLHFHVRSFFRNGMWLRFRRDVKTPIESLPLDLTLVLPGQQTLSVRGRVSVVEVAPSDAQGLCAVELEEPSAEVRTAIGRYLFSVTDQLEVENLEALGYPVPDFEHSMVFSLARTAEEIRDMMALRLLAYGTREGARLQGVTDPMKMKDGFDDHSLILQVRVGGKAIGTGRIIFNDGDRDRTEIGRFAALPEWLWEGGFVECSRVATAPGIRRRDVFSTISRHTLRIAYQAGVRYILADCEAHLLEPYKRRGAQELGLTFVHPLEGKTLHVIYTDVEAILDTLERNRMPLKALWSAVGEPPLTDFSRSATGAAPVPPVPT